MRTRHYTGGKFFLWKFVVGKFWLKTFGGKFLMNTCGWEIFGRNVLVEMPYLISLNPLFSKKNIEHVGRLKHIFCLCLCMCLRFVFFITRCHVNVIFENLENPALREKKIWHTLSLFARFLREFHLSA